ncbi:MAG: cyclic nucleotide-binding domain-containing protein, partial [Thermoplasmatota archaeon]
MPKRTKADWEGSTYAKAKARSAERQDPFTTFAGREVEHERTKAVADPGEGDEGPSSEPLADALLGAASLRSLSAGQPLFARGEEPDGLYALLDGAIRVSGTSESGKEAL